jgi:hypothetical protein
MPTKTGGPACPECSSKNPLPIAYGLPGEEMIEAHERGEIALGGCCLTGDDPDWACRSCGLRYHTLWRLTPELRQLVDMYNWQREDVLKAQKALQKCAARIADTDPNDAQFGDLAHEHRAAFGRWMESCRAFQEAFANLNRAMHQQMQPTQATPARHVAVSYVE